MAEGRGDTPAVLPWESDRGDDERRRLASASVTARRLAGIACD